MLPRTADVIRQRPPSIQYAQLQATATFTTTPEATKSTAMTTRRITRPS
ncbi:MAG: hypothetical protein ACYTA3_14735 [Planctomycetota bacterium]